MLDVSNRPRVDVDLVERGARTLLDAFARLLTELGHREAVRVLPLVGTAGARVAGTASLRAVTIGFHLLSVAEQHATAIYRASARATGKVESGLWASTLAELARMPGSREAIVAALAQLHVEPVLTAHPTEARRISALEQWLELFEQLGLEEVAKLDHDDLLERLERLYRTGEVRLRKPTLADERDVVVHTLVRVVAPALVHVERAAAEALATGSGADRVTFPSVTFGTWVGGDRDGHPLVTADVTSESLRIYRRAALGLHRTNLTRLARALSISEVDAAAPRALAERAEGARAALGEAGEEAVRRNPEEPFRAFVGLMLAQLPDEDGDGPAAYSSPAALLEDLALLRASLVEVGAGRIARRHVDPVVSAVRAFGFHLVTLDVRQNSFVHDRALDALLRASGERAGGFPEWPEPDRRALLARETESARPFTMPGATLDPDADVAVAPLRVLAEHRRRWGDAGLGAFIVSMTRDVSDLLVPYLLSREAGLLVSTPDGITSPIQVVPLFETLDDLERAPAVLDAYLGVPIVRRSLAAASKDEAGRPVQQVMLGYSDSNKDAGPCASLWGVHVAQRKLLEVAERHGVGLRFFHGRGGSASRGAGPTFRFLSALPRGSLDAGVRLTEQGETIFQKYGTVEAASYNIELLLAGALRRRVLDANPPAPTSDEERLATWLSEVAQASTVAYRRLLESEGLVLFFREATPVDVLEQSGIGSRPARRSGRATLADLRAIPWVFAWAQSRFALTGWFGVGSGLEALERRDPGAFRALCARALTWAPMRYIVGNASVSLLTTDEEMMQRYASLVTDAPTRERVLREVRDELERTRRVLELAYGAPLASARGRIHRLLSFRTEALRAVHERQVDLLRDWRGRGRPDDATKIELLGTVNAIAAGLRTTG